jgi:hypothetical protein
MVAPFTGDAFISPDVFATNTCFEMRKISTNTFKLEKARGSQEEAEQTEEAERE